MVKTIADTVLPLFNEVFFSAIAASCVFKNMQLFKTYPCLQNFLSFVS